MTRDCMAGFRASVAATGSSGGGGSTSTNNSSGGGGQGYSISKSTCSSTSCTCTGSTDLLSRIRGRFGPCLCIRSWSRRARSGRRSGCN